MSVNYPGDGLEMSKTETTEKHKLQWDSTKIDYIKSVLKELEESKEVKLYKVCLAMLKQLKDKVGY